MSLLKTGYSLAGFFTRKTRPLFRDKINEGELALRLILTWEN